MKKNYILILFSLLFLNFNAKAFDPSKLGDVLNEGANILKQLEDAVDKKSQQNADPAPVKQPVKPKNVKSTPQNETPDPFENSPPSPVKDLEKERKEKVISELGGYCEPYKQSLLQGQEKKSGYERECKEYFDLTGFNKERIEIKKAKKKEAYKKAENMKNKMSLSDRWYFNEWHIYNSGYFLMAMTPDERRALLLLESVQCMDQAFLIAEKKWEYNDKLVELKNKCKGATKWTIEEYQTLVDLILNRKFYNNKDGFAKDSNNVVVKRWLSLPKILNSCIASIADLPPSKRPDHSKTSYPKAWEGDSPNANYCKLQIIDGKYN